MGDGVIQALEIGKQPQENQFIQFATSYIWQQFH